MTEINPFFKTGNILFMDFGGKVVKVIKMINHNNKRHNKVMVEVNRAPDEPVTLDKMTNTVFHIHWDDGEQGYYELVDVWPYKLRDLPTSFCIASHGMYSETFQNWFLARKSGSIDDMEMAVYIYFQVNPDNICENSPSSPSA